MHGSCSGYESGVTAMTDHKRLVELPEIPDGEKISPADADGIGNYGHRWASSSLWF